MNLLQSELIEHGKVLKAFSNLPSELKQYILTFYNTRGKPPEPPFLRTF